MKEVSRETAREADLAAQAAVDRLESDATASGTVVDPLFAFEVHRAAWAARTGGDVVRVVSGPAVDLAGQSRTGT